MVLSAGRQHSGVQGVFIETNHNADSWRILSSAFYPYDSNHADLFSYLLHIQQEKETRATLRDMAAADYYISRLFAECARGLLDNSPGMIRTVDIVLMNKLSLWEEEIHVNTPWRCELGRPWMVARQIQAPVLGGTTPTTHFNDIPVADGIRTLARRCSEEIVVYVNLGLISRVLTCSRNEDALLHDFDAGPGTCCINAFAHKIGIAQGIDRDGDTAGAGEVNTDCVVQLHRRLKTIQKKCGTRLTPSQLLPLIHTKCVNKLSQHDAMATITAFTAYTIFRYFKEELYPKGLGVSVWVGGGGANNRTLFECLAAYFETTPLHSVEELDIPVHGFIPTCEGLAFDKLISRASFSKNNEDPLSYFYELTNYPW